MQRDYHGSRRYNVDHLFDNREILGLRGGDKIHLIVKIQALVRGALARRKVKNVYGFETKTMGGTDKNDMVPNYDNPLVQNIKKRLGQFNYEPAPKKDQTRRIFRGMSILENGAKYEGEWDSDRNVRDGKGLQVWADGSLYEGYWRNDKANGRGRLIHADGDIYEGEWKDDKAHGYGKYFHTDGAMYEGYWKEDK